MSSNLNLKTVETTQGIFLGLKTVAPSGNKSLWQSWMLTQAHKMWRDDSISSDQLCLLIDEICCH